MTYKKTWLSYILWAAFVCITGILLANYSVLFWKTQISPDTSIYTVGFIFIVFALVAGFYFLIKKTLAEAINKHKINKHTVLMWETFIVLCIFSIALLYRLYLCLQNGTDSIIETELYHMAIVRKGTELKPIVHGASYIYVQFLSFVFTFLGNKIMAAVWVQALIEMITILLVYFLIRKMAGKIPACIAILALSVSTVYTDKIFSLTPEVFFFFLYILGMFILGSYVKAYCNNSLGRMETIIGAVFSGAIIGILTYLDAISITLIIILAGLITGVHANTSMRKITSLLPFALSIIMCMLTFAGILSIDAYLSGDEIGVILRGILYLYNQNLSIDTVIYQNSYFIIESIIQVILAAFLIIAFWNKNEIWNFTPWICLMLFLTTATIINIGVMRYHIFYVYIWSVLAGLGLQHSLMVNAIKQSIEIENDAEYNREQSIETIDNTECSNRQTIETGNDAEYPETLTENYKKPRFIENPLPLPKKHEKKEIDYQYEVTQEQMKFDIDVKDDDDFDV